MTKVFSRTYILAFLNKANAGVLVFVLIFAPFFLIPREARASTGYPVPHITSFNAVTLANGNFLPVSHGSQESVSSTEAQEQIYMFKAGTWSGLSVYVRAVNASGSTTLTVRVNGSDTSVSVTVPQNSTGLFQDLSNTASVSVGDLVSIGVTTTAGTLPIGSITNLFTSNDGDSVQYFSSYGPSGGFQNSDRFIRPASATIPNNITVNSNAGNRIQHASTIRGIQVYVSTNTRNGTSTFKSRVGVNTGNNTATIPASTTGLFTGTNSQSMNAGNIFNVISAVGGSSGSVILGRVALYVVSNNPQEITFLGARQVARNTSSTANVWNFAGGELRFSFGAETDGRSYPITPGVMSGLQYHASANASNRDLAMVLRKNGSDGNQNIDYTSGTTGWVQDTTNSDTFDNNDFSAIRTTRSSAGTGNTTFEHHSMKYTMDEILPTYTQSAYRLFNNDNSTDVGSALDTQDTPVTLASAGDAFRLRLLVNVDTNRLDASGEDFKLQYVDKGGGSCASPSGGTPAVYTDVTGATLIAYNDNATPTDGSALTSNANDPTNGGNTIVNQTYEESNNFTNSEGVILSGQDGKWDFSLIDNGATAGSTYCLRAVLSDDTVFGDYDVYPEVTIPSSGAQTITFSISDNTIGFGTISPSATRYATGDTTGTGSEASAHTFDVSTNASSGYVVLINGDTLKNGSHDIDACGASCTLSAGTEQFGLRITASGGSGAVSSPYNHASNYAYEATSTVSDEVASAGSGDGDTTTYSVRYGANVSNITASGTYNSTLTYTVVPSF